MTNRVGGTVKNTDLVGLVHRWWWLQAIILRRSMLIPPMSTTVTSWVWANAGCLTNALDLLRIRSNPGERAKVRTADRVITLAAGVKGGCLLSSSNCSASSTVWLKALLLLKSSTCSWRVLFGSKFLRRRACLKHTTPSGIPSAFAGNLVSWKKCNNPGMKTTVTNHLVEDSTCLETSWNFQLPIAWDILKLSTTN